MSHLPILFVRRHSNALALSARPLSHSPDPISRVSPVHSDHQPLFSAPQAGFSLICLHFIGSPCPNTAFAVALSESCHVQSNTVVAVVKAKADFRQTVAVMAYAHSSLRWTSIASPGASAEMVPLAVSCILQRSVLLPDSG